MTKTVQCHSCNKQKPENQCIVRQAASKRKLNRCNDCLIKVKLAKQAKNIAIQKAHDD